MQDKVLVPVILSIPPKPLKKASFLDYSKTSALTFGVVCLGVLSTIQLIYKIC